MTVLPQAYIEQMQRLLAAEAEAFLQSYAEPRTQGLRLNTYKIGARREQVLQSLTEAFGLEPVPWCESGYYYPEDRRPGKHPLHAAGLYYIQEPSAMSAVELLAPVPGDLVLDLAAAPGGKSTHIADKLQGKGLLVSNEIHPVRAKSLAENVERMGIANAVVVNATPQQLAAKFPQVFDKIMVDAPCSGEGMFRKDPDTIGEWSPQHVDMCAARQLDILQSAVTMLKPGGRLAYSTCTFNKQENEQTVQALLAEFPALRLLRTERIWPHRQRGEGHFVAILELSTQAGHPEAPSVGAAAETGNRRKERPARGKRGAGRPEEDALRLFRRLAESIGGEAWADELQAWLGPGKPLLFGEQLYWLPAAEGGALSGNWLHGLKVLRPGLHLAELKKDRAEPAHALALALPARLASGIPSFRLDEDGVAAAERYLRGETLETDAPGSGWTLVTLDGLALGWGKQSGTQIKNHYPKGLRRP